MHKLEYELSFAAPTSIYISQSAACHLLSKAPSTSFSFVLALNLSQYLTKSLLKFAKILRHNEIELSEFISSFSDLGLKAAILIPSNLQCCKLVHK